MIYYYFIIIIYYYYAVAQLVEELRIKSRDRGFDYGRSHWDFIFD